jgi:hypothetical protein
LLFQIISAQPKNVKGIKMAIVLEANYSKKIGLPGYSSHQYMVTLRTEVADLNQVPAESTRLYSMLQASVDREIQQVGFLPENGSRNSNGHGHKPTGNAAQSGGSNSHGNREHWQCSPKQKAYILDLVEQHQLDKNKVDALAQERFGKAVRALNKLEASGLIEELKEQIGQSGAPNGRPNQPAGGR